MPHRQRPPALASLPACHSSGLGGPCGLGEPSRAAPGACGRARSPQLRFRAIAMPRLNSARRAHPGDMRNSLIRCEIDRQGQGGGGREARAFSGVGLREKNFSTGPMVRLYSVYDRAKTVVRTVLLALAPRNFTPGPSFSGGAGRLPLAASKELSDGPVTPSPSRAAFGLLLGAATPARSGASGARGAARAACRSG